MTIFVLTRELSIILFVTVVLCTLFCGKDADNGNGDLISFWKNDRDNDAEDFKGACPQKTGLSCAGAFSNDGDVFLTPDFTTINIKLIKILIYFLIIPLDLSSLFIGDQSRIFGSFLFTANFSN